MIDTIAFRVPVTPVQFERLVQRSKVYKCNDNYNNKRIYEFYRIDTPIGSYSRSINITFDIENEIKVELSLPKYLHNHNINLINCDNFTSYLDRLHHDICKDISDIPSPMYWNFCRIDFCYAWRVLDDVKAISLLNQFKVINFPRKHKKVYDTSVMWYGTNYSVKFYQKSEEFFHHDFKAMKEHSFDRAYELLQLSKGVVRFEITMRSAQLREEFKYQQGQPLLLTFLVDNAICIKILNKYLNKMAILREGYTNTYEEAYQKLFSKYKTAKAIRLYQYLSIITSGNPTDEIVAKLYPYRTAWDNKRQLFRAKVGIIKSSVESNFSVTIPSEYGVQTL
jgi:hypothetical protein